MELLFGMSAIMMMKTMMMRWREGERANESLTQRHSRDLIDPS